MKLRAEFDENNPNVGSDVIDWEAEVDPNLTYSENRAKIMRDEYYQTYKWGRQERSYSARHVVRQVYNPATDRMENRAVMIGVDDEPRMSPTARTEYQTSRPAPLPLPGEVGGQMVPTHDAFTPYTTYAEDSYGAYEEPTERYVGRSSAVPNPNTAGMSSIHHFASPLRHGASRLKESLQRRAAIKSARRERYNA